MKGTGRPGHQLTPGAVRKKNLIVDGVVLGAVVPMNNPGHAWCKSTPTLLIKREVYMEFQYTDKTKQMFEDIKKSIPKFPDMRGIYIGSIEYTMAHLIAKEYDDFLLREFEKRGYTREELQNSKHKLEKRIDRSVDGKEIHKYFVDDKLVLEVSSRYEIISENF